MVFICWSYGAQSDRIVSGIQKKTSHGNVQQKWFLMLKGTSSHYGHVIYGSSGVLFLRYAMSWLAECVNAVLRNFQDICLNSRPRRNSVFFEGSRVAFSQPSGSSEETAC